MSGVDGATSAHDIMEENESVSENFNHSSIFDIRSGSELPFLVTHWLANFSIDSRNPKDDSTRDALQKIHKAADELASAFYSIGAFGTFITRNYEQMEQKPLRICTVARDLNDNDVPAFTATNRLYSDVKRQWGESCPAEQLEILVESAQSARVAVETAVAIERKLASGNGVNLILAAGESVSASVHAPESGRTILDNNVELLESANTVKPVEISVSSLHQPVLLLDAPFKDSQSDRITGAFRKHSSNTLLASSYSIVANEASRLVTLFLDNKKSFKDSDSCLRSATRSLDLQKSRLTDLRKQRDAVLRKQLRQSNVQDGVKDTTNLDVAKSIAFNGATNNPVQLLEDENARPNFSQMNELGNTRYTELISELTDIDSNEQNCTRIIAQLERDVPKLTDNLLDASRSLEVAKKNAYAVFAKLKRHRHFYHDPNRIVNGRQSLSKNNILSKLHVRELGHFYRGNNVSARMALQSGSPQGIAYDIQKSLLSHRFSMAATINCHLHYPIYCLRFDRTGRYFITGADDYLVRVFCLAENVIVKHPKIERSNFLRGAVLVCTLKGHAGVINDICVSSDNCFLATASEDGDCRVWGLKDGCNVAILRGHKGGANMVSWSTLTPYRLVTTSADGLARIWDIREACLKRYGNIIGKRPEYRLEVRGKSLDHVDRNGSFIGNKTPSNDKAYDANCAASTTHCDEEQPGAVLEIPLPPLPASLSGQNQGILDFPEVMVVGSESDQSQSDNERQPGRFIENDIIDDGVKLLTKLQHGASTEERSGAPGTRSRRISVKVICVARCPYGGHFATGSDDGICRIWKDEDDLQIEDMDAILSGKRRCQQTVRFSTRKSIEPLLVLDGHMSAVTDLMYSSSGDRILTASQKDGIVMIWSWNQDPCERQKMTGLGSPSRRKPDVKKSHILIKLINPRTAELPGPSTGSRKLMNRSQSCNVCCDVVNWVKDDFQIVTSQTELIKPNGTEIIPGSHYLFLWDSWTGHCLLGISGAHSKSVPVLVSHPNHPSIMCSAGADGVLKLWDWESCSCLYSYSNVADFGPLEENEIGKAVGFLDGTFSPDGTTLVVTDEKGRITVFDCCSVQKYETVAHIVQCPNWMKEQYFSNDYYDLLYDETGYCVEKVSMKSPHLAPRGSRCSHTGAPVQEQVAETFAKLKGPPLLGEAACRWNREVIRHKAEVMMQRAAADRGTPCLVRQFDPQTTLLLQSGGHSPLLKAPKYKSDIHEAHRPRVNHHSFNNSASRTLSSNFRWTDAYQEAIRADDNEPEPDFESDDEDFQLVESHLADSRSPVSPTHLSVDFDDSTVDSSPMSRRRQNSTTPSRISRRRRRIFEDEDSDEGDLDEFMSTNNHPSGAFVSDYDVHYFRLPTNRRICRLWARRLESRQSYEGKKKYSPQVGDLVVYIPRAHMETIQAFPGLIEPWLSWPDDCAWPVVQCRVLNVRYRFPFIHFSSGNTIGHNKSIVAIVTLEIVGVPSAVYNGSLPWPGPNFTQPTEKHCFEVCLFENSQSDFVFPYSLYSTRLREISSFIDKGPSNESQLEIYLAESTGEEDHCFYPWTARLDDIEVENEDRLQHACLRGSGYNSVRISWLDREKDNVSPWEINVKSSEKGQLYETLTEYEKSVVLEALNRIREIDDNTDFLHPVNESRFSDYGTRIEVPMDLTFIHKRLEADYYTNKLSVAADIRLILDNCVKYNGEDHVLSGIARNMLQRFESLVLSANEQSLFHKCDHPLLPANSRVPRVDRIHREPHPSAEGASQRRSRSRLDARPQLIGRTRVGSRTSLEALPPPEEPEPTSSSASGRHGRRSSGRSRHLESQDAEEETNESSGTNLRRSARNVSTRNSVHGRSLRSQDSSNSLAERNGNRLLRRGNRDPSGRNGTNTSIAQSLPRIRFISSRREVELRHDSIDPAPSTLSRLTGRSASLSGGNMVPMVDQARAGTSVETKTSLSGRSAKEDEDVHISSASKYLGPTKNQATEVASRKVNPKASNIDYQHDDASDSNDQKPNARPSRSCSKVVSNDNEEETFFHNDSSQCCASESWTGTQKQNKRKPRTAKRPPPEELESDLQSESEQSQPDKGSFCEDNSDSDEAHWSQSKTSTARKQARSSRQKKQSPARRTRATATSQKSYVDPSSDEFNSICTSNESSDESTVSISRSSPMKRKRKANSNNGGKTNRNKKSKNDFEYKASNGRWPEINPRQIVQIGKDVIALLKQLDENDVFAVPVLETYPQHSATYPMVVSTPMDFRTILQQRLPAYKSITELQDDLKLVFENCINFTGPTSETGRLSKKMLQEMNEAFYKVCSSRHVRLEK